MSEKLSKNIGSFRKPPRTKNAQIRIYYFKILDATGLNSKYMPKGNTLNHFQMHPKCTLNSRNVRICWTVSIKMELLWTL
jgi:hypothetical protein